MEEEEDSGAAEQRQQMDESGRGSGENVQSGLEEIITGLSAGKWTKASLQWGQMREPGKNQFFST